MGSQYSKDDQIDLYMFTNKQFYIAGDYVEGEVYLNAKSTRSYSNICLKLIGLQYIYWSEGSGKNRRSYTNRHDSYNEHMLLVNFHNTVAAGQYSFPFRFLLPSMMSGSFIHSQNCFIKYTLRVELVHPTEQKGTQPFEMFLNIMEPPRMPIGAISLSNNVNSKCCHCCMDYGNTVANLNCSKNFVVNGQSISINGSINNTQGKQIVKQHKIVLQECIIMISSGGRIRKWVNAQYPIYKDQTPVQPGTTKQFAINAIVPPNIVKYTAIGRITARYFILHLYTSYGCCANTAQAMLHLIVHSRTPMIVEKKLMPPPQNWYPKTFPQVQCETLKPFMYAPLGQIPFLNMPGNNNIVINTMNAEYPSMANQYQQPTQDFKPVIDQQLYAGYQPTFYDQGMFTEEQKQMQGYNGYQPYFAGETSQQNLIRKG